MHYFTGRKFVRGFSVDGFWWALLFSLLLSVITSLLYTEEAARKKRDAD